MLTGAIISYLLVGVLLTYLFMSYVADDDTDVMFVPFTLLFWPGCILSAIIVSTGVALVRYFKRHSVKKTADEDQPPIDNNVRQTNMKYSHQSVRLFTMMPRL